MRDLEYAQKGNSFYDDAMQGTLFIFSYKAGAMMKKWIALIVLFLPLHFSCKIAELDELEIFTDPPRFTEFVAVSSADTGKFFTDKIEINKGETVTVTYTVIDAETLDFYYNDQCFIHDPTVDNPERAGYMFQDCQNSFIFKLVATNRIGSASKKIEIIVR